jgi:hypothetical protein
VDEYSPVPIKDSNEKGLGCPLKYDCRLEVIDREALLVRCYLDGLTICPNAIPFGSARYCGALLKRKQP